MKKEKMHTEATKNQLILLTLGVIFYFSYWINQIGMAKTIIIILPNTASLVNVILLSFIFWPILLVLFFVWGVVEEAYAHGVNDNNRLILFSLRFTVPMTSFFLYLFGKLNIGFSLLISLIALYVCKLICKSNENEILFNLFYINNKLNKTWLILTVISSMYFGAFFGETVQNTFSARIISESKEQYYPYLGFISGLHVIKHDKNVLFMGDVEVKQAETPAKAP